jgi:2-C-methyl-D-erythritol 4-phosphate cytidylyltransferase
LVAGGTGDRFGRPGGKQLARVAGRPVLWWALRACAAAEGVAAVVLVCPTERTREYVEAAQGAVPPGITLATAASGQTRQESVAAGLRAISDDFDLVIVHDGARPVVTSGLVDRLIGELASRSELDGVVVGHPSVDTLKIVEGDVIVDTPDRGMFWQVQTPQVFRREVLVRAHAQAAAAGFTGTDDASLVERIGGSVAVSMGPRDNIKVTVEEDLALAEAALARADGG